MKLRPIKYEPSGDPYDAVKDEVHEFEFDGRRVVLTRVPIHRDPIDSMLGVRRYGKDQVALGHPGENRRYEVRVDGDLVGHAIRPFGSGAAMPYLGHALYEGYQPDLGRHGYPELDRDARLRDEADSKDLSSVARRFAGWRAKGMALTWDELVAKRNALDEAETRDRRELAERMAEDDSKRYRQLTEREARRGDTVAGLREIQERFGSELTNYQTQALLDAIAHADVTTLNPFDREFIARMEGRQPVDEW
jgi:hypothetical protein